MNRHRGRGRSLRRRYGRALPKHPAKRAAALQKKATKQDAQALRVAKSATTAEHRLEQCKTKLGGKIRALKEKESALKNEASANRALAATLSR